MNVNDILSVCLITYNHEKYVAQAIDSILKQETSFNWKLVVADDCSTDNTREILKEYQQKFPEKIHLILQEKNVGPAENFIQLITFPKSKYIAYLEGDDYWSDCLKLQKQFDILELNTDCTLCFTDNSKLYSNGILKKPVSKDIKIKSSFVEIVEGNYITTLTVFFKKPSEFILPEWYKDVKIGDWVLYLILLSTGKFAYYLNQDTAVYRYGIGVSSKMRKKNSAILEEKQKILQKIFFESFASKYTNEITNAIKKNKYALLSSYIRESNYKMSILTFLKLFFKDNSIHVLRFSAYSILKKFTK